MKASSKTKIQGFQVVEKECIWMKAGVINFRVCDSAYDCSRCAFDKGMRRAMGIDPAVRSEKIAPDWAAHLQRKFAGADRPCRHSLTGRVQAPKICTLNYECYHCAYDQMLDDMDLNLSTRRPRTVLAGGYLLAEDYYYHPGHSWVRIEHGGRSRIGLDDFAACLFGPSRQVTLPPLGAVVQQNRIGWSFQRDGREAAVLSPLSGTVLAVNPDVPAHPEILHEDPYHGGWLFMVEPNRTHKDLKNLFFGDQSRRWMESESEHLLAMMGPEYEGLAATGSRGIRDVVGTVDRPEWNALAQRFLQTVTRPPAGG
ncbi:MAG: glycine cleavage system protein H [Desulfobacteraceae bacterium]|jgi:glycine cleavage system H lipoate-binding protein